jgi:quercetin dioxygenase-like cupin family protein
MPPLGLDRRRELVEVHGVQRVGAGVLAVCRGGPPSSYVASASLDSGNIMKNSARFAVVGAVIAGLSLAATAANATPPGPGVTGTVITDKIVGDKHIVIREITLPPGQSTGWHFHDGNLVGLVRQGTLSHFDSSCKSDGVYRTGNSIIEPSGANHVHIGRNLGRTPVVLDVLYILPVGKPLSEDAPNPGCDFQ